MLEFESEHFRKSRFPQGIFQTPTPQATELFIQPVIVLFLWLVESALICSTGQAYKNIFDWWISKATFRRSTFM